MSDATVKKMGSPRPMAFGAERTIVMGCENVSVRRAYSFVKDRLIFKPKAIITVGDHGIAGVAKRYAQSNMDTYIEGFWQSESHGEVGANATHMMHKRLLQNSSPTSAMFFWDGVDRNTRDIINQTILWHRDMNPALSIRIYRIEGMNFMIDRDNPAYRTITRFQEESTMPF